MRLGRRTLDGFWNPYRSSYTSSISVIETAEKKKDDETEEEQTDVKKVPFGFGRALEDA